MAVVVSINGTDRASSIKPFSSLKTPGRTASGRIVEVSPYTLTIEKEQTLLITDGGVVTFGGRLKSIKKSDFNVAGTRQYTFEATNYDSELKASICDTGALRTASESDAARIAWLFTTFDTRGITVGSKVLTVMATMPTAQDFTGMTLEEAMDDICKYTGAQWYIEPLAGGSKELHYFSSETNNAPFAIDLQSPNGTTKFPARDFDFTEDTIDYYCDVYIIGDGIQGWRHVEDYGGTPAFSPRREAKIRDTNIKDATMLNAVGDAFLREHNRSQDQGTLTCWQPGLREGQNLSIDNDDYWVGTRVYRIQSMEPQYRNDGTARYVVKFGTIPAPSIEDLLREARNQLTELQNVTTEVVNTVPSIDDLTAGGANLVLNSSFESDPTGNWDVGTGWTVNYASAQPAFWGGEVARCVRSGTASGELATTNYIAVDRTLDYWFSFWSWLIARSAGNARAYVREYSAANALLQTTMLADIAAAQTKWTRHFLHFGPSAGTGIIGFHASTVKVKLAFVFEGSANGTWEIDGVQAEAGKLITAYAPRPQELVDQQITATQIADDAITTPKLIANAVVAGKIATGAVTADKIGSNEILVGHLRDPANHMLVPNPGFEDTTGIVVGNTSQPIRGWESQSYARVVNTPVDSGGFALELAGNGTNRDFRSAFVPVTPERVLRFRAQIRGNAGNVAGAAGGLGIDWYDTNKALISTTSFALQTVGTTASYALLQMADQTVPTGAVYMKFILRITSGATSGSEVYFDTLDAFYLDDDVSHAGGNVKIDSTGVTIANGKLTLTDEFGYTALAGALIAGNLADYLHSGVYNGTFQNGIGGGGTVAAGRTSNLPYWTVTKTNATAVHSAGQVSTVFSGTTGVRQLELVSDKVPCDPEAWYFAKIYGEATAAAGQGVSLAGLIFWYDAAGAFISSSTSVGFEPTPLASGTDIPKQWLIGNPMQAPSNARFMAISARISLSQGGTGAGNSGILYAAGLEKQRMTDPRLFRAPSSVTLSTVFQDLVSTRTIGNAGPYPVDPAGGQRFLVLAVVDSSVGSSGVGDTECRLVHGEFNNSLTVEAELLKWAPQTTATGQVTASQAWLVTTVATASGTYEFRLQGRKTVNAGSAVMTTYSMLLIWPL